MSIVLDNNKLVRNEGDVSEQVGKSIRSYMEKNGLPEHSFPEVYDFFHEKQNGNFDNDTGELLPKNERIEKDFIFAVRDADAKGELFMQKYYTIPISKTLVDLAHKHKYQLILDSKRKDKEFSIDRTLARVSELVVGEREEDMKQLLDACIETVESSYDVAFLPHTDAVFIPHIEGMVYAHDGNRKEMLSYNIDGGNFPLTLRMANDLIDENIEKSYIERAYEQADPLDEGAMTLDKQHNRAEITEINYLGTDFEIVVSDEPIIRNVHPIYITDKSDNSIYRAFVSSLPDGSIPLDPESEVSRMISFQSSMTKNEVISNNIELPELIDRQVQHIEVAGGFRGDLSPAEKKVVAIKNLHGTEAGREALKEAALNYLRENPREIILTSHNLSTAIFAQSVIGGFKNGDSEREQQVRDKIDEVFRTELELCDSNSFVEITDKNAIDSFVSKEWTQISKEKYYEMLEVLPPLMWRRENGAEMFFSQEMTYGTLSSCFVEVDGNYYTATRDTKGAQLEGFVEEIRRQVSESKGNTLTEEGVYELMKEIHHCEQMSNISVLDAQAFPNAREELMKTSAEYLEERERIVRESGMTRDEIFEVGTRYEEKMVSAEKSKNETKRQEGAQDKEKSKHLGLK